MAIDRRLRSRVIAFLECELPDVSKELFGGSSPAALALAERTPFFSEFEPSINTYQPGGRFDPHCDGYALTIVLTLNPGAFIGGGTDFWNPVAGKAGKAGKETEKESCQRPPFLRIEPQPGAVGVGVIFGGNVRHAGRSVVEGTRCVLWHTKINPSPPPSIISLAGGRGSGIPVSNLSA